jgi:hypothetical protein
LRRLLPLLFVVAVYVSACASNQPAPPPLPTVPDWESIPPGVSSALCQRLQMDGIGTIGSEVSIVKVTQPIATAQALAVLGKPKRPVSILQRALPIATTSTGTGACTWKAIDALDPNRQFDSMVVELSAPVANPAAKSAAGMLARVSLGGTHPNWYWIELIPHSAGWSVGRIFPLSL